MDMQSYMWSCELKEKPEIILVGATYIGRDLGPRVAAKIKNRTLQPTVRDSRIEEGTNNLLNPRPAFGGKSYGHPIVCPENIDHKCPQLDLEF